MTSRFPRALLLVAFSLSAVVAADFSALPNTETDLSKPLMPAAEAVAKMQLPEGFSARLIASEPDVENPIAMSWDGHGRMWVAENFTYAERAVRFDLSLKDRILIFEEREGGQAPSRRVFADDLQMLTSIAPGRGGVYAMCPPQLLFIPDRNGDGVADGPPEVVLDGFTVAKENYHNYANGLKWGPDGWLYGRCGHSCPGEIGAPGSAKNMRVPIEGGMWRYHPERHVFEALNSGTTNPWGSDWDKHGELFFINTVIGHLWHSIAGAHYKRSSLDPNAHTYATIDQHADHYHFDTGKGWTADRDGGVNTLGGGHAHAGMLIYQGDNWPSIWRDKLFTLNFHGRRINVDRLEREGSGYVGKHEPDLVQMADPWFRGLELSTGPDGGVFVLDWSDTGECHESTGVHRESGRIFKITHRDGKPLPDGAADLAALDSPALAKLHRSPNEWQVREARLLLAERALDGADLKAANAELLSQFKNEKDAVLRLRALWTLRLTGAAGDDLLRALLHDGDEHLRTWAIRLLSDAWPLDLCNGARPKREESAPSPELLGEFVKMGREDGSGLVRLTLASTLQRLPWKDRGALAGALANRAEDAADHNLPSLLWSGLEPVAAGFPEQLTRIAQGTDWPALRRFIGRRLAEDLVANAGPLNGLLRALKDSPEPARTDVLLGMHEALAGLRKAPKPAAWDEFQATLAGAAEPEVRDRLRGLSTLFGDGRALEEVKAIALNSKAELATREAALRTLIEGRPDDLRAICEKLLDVRFLNTTAARGLALFDDPAIALKLAKSYRNFSPAGRIAVLDTLVSRPTFALALLDNVDEKKIPRADITAFHARQIRGFKNEALDGRLAAVWGELHESAADKTKLIAELKSRLTPAVLAGANLSAGRGLFQVCASCHTLYGEGGKIGPELTGSGRGNLDYLLENIVEPSAVVTAEYRMTTLTLKDGRVLNGMVSAQSARSLTLRSMSDTQTLDRTDIAREEVSPISMMPEGLLQALSETQVRDLIGYLMHPVQVPLVPAAN